MLFDERIGSAWRKPEPKVDGLRESQKQKKGHRRVAAPVKGVVEEKEGAHFCVRK